MKQVLLVQPNYRVQREKGMWLCNMNLGLAYIGAVLEDHDIPVKVLDANAEDLTAEEVVKKAEGYSIVGISGMTPAHNFITRVAKLLPEDTLKIAGGPHPTAVPELMLKEGFDIVVRGEGEYTFLEIAQDKDILEIKGISFIFEKRLVHNPDREWLNPNDLPLPARRLFIENGLRKPYGSAGALYSPMATMFTSRGCPFTCYFCCKKIFGYRFRALSVENVLREMEDLVENHGVREIDFYDDTWNTDLKRANIILDEIAGRDWDVKLRCSNGLRVEKITDEFMGKFVRAGGIWTGLGVESGNQRVLNLIPKGTTIEMIEKAMKILKKYPVIVNGFFMLGLLGDTKESMQDTLDFSRKLNPDIAQFTIATPYPGTRFYDMVKKDGELLIKDWDQFHHTTGKMLYRYPGTTEPEVVEEFYKRAHKEFYFRASYILHQLGNLKSPAHLKFFIRGAKTIAKIGGLE